MPELVDRLLEILGFATGLACVVLVVRQKIANFPIGIASNVFFLISFARHRLYGDAGLQIVYVALGFYGWYSWLYGGQRRKQLEVATASPRVRLAIAFLIVLGTQLLMFTLYASGGSAPILDALTTMLSLAAQLLLNRKYIENWYLWITADVLYIIMYLQRGLNLTALLYAVFLMLCLVGLQQWRRELQQRDSLATCETP
jgi:nicotinamide mononucleotide transporter